MCRICALENNLEPRTAVLPQVAALGLLASVYIVLYWFCPVRLWLWGSGQGFSAFHSLPPKLLAVLSPLHGRKTAQPAPKSCTSTQPPQHTANLFTGHDGEGHARPPIHDAPTRQTDSQHTPHGNSHTLRPIATSTDQIRTYHIISYQSHSSP
jgi:hypothetical protein